jgi:glycosyltransferase involved in cell wall biosynthesis
VSTRIGVLGPITVTPLAEYLTLSDTIVSKGSGGTPIVSLVSGLIEAGHDISVYSFGFDLPVGEMKIYTGPHLRIYLGHYRAAKRMRDLFREEREQLVRMIQRDNPALLHAHWTYEFAMAALASGLPTLVTVHDCASKVLRLQPDLYRLGRYFMNRYVLKHAKHVSAVSPYIQSYARKFTKCDIHLIPNMIMDHWFESNRIPQTNHNPVRSFRVASFVTWGSMRNATLAIQAFQEFRSVVNSAEYHLYGSGFESGGPAQAWAVKKGVDKGLFFHGQIEYENVPIEMKNASVILHPSLEESFSMVIAEAMALGVPVVAGVQTGGVPWVLDYGTAGVLVDVKKTEEIAGALHHLYENPELLKELVSYAQIRARAMFSSAAVIPQYEAIYDRILSGSSVMNTYAVRINGS